MRTISIAASVLLAMTCANSAHAQGHAEPILPGADGSVCEFIALNIGAATGVPKEYGASSQTHPFSDMLVKRAAADVDGDGDIELLDYQISPAGESPVHYGFREDYRWRDQAPKGVDRRDELRWWESGRWLYFRDAWHLVYFQDRGANLASHVITFGKTQATFACKFTARYRETILLSAAPAVDAAYKARIERKPFREGTGTALSDNDKRYLSALPGGFRERSGSLYGDGVHWSVTVRIETAVHSADVDGDGVSERFAQMTVSSGATPPCGATYFELLPNQGSSEPDPVKRDRWRDLQEVSYSGVGKYAATCGVEHDILEVDGVGYLYTARFDRDVIARQLSRLDPRDNVLTLVKLSQFQLEHVVDFDSTK